MDKSNQKLRRDWYNTFGLNGNDARRLESALCTLADFEGVLKQELRVNGHSDWDHAHVCEVLRKIIDGWEDT